MVHEKEGQYIHQTQREVSNIEISEWTTLHGFVDLKPFITGCNSGKTGSEKPHLTVNGFIEFTVRRLHSFCQGLNESTRMWVDCNSAN